jgi:hypothetical protein
MVEKVKQYVKMHQPLIGAVLIIFGGIYQFLNALCWGWWNVGKIEYRTSITLQQYFAMYLGFLATPLFILSFSLAIVGVALICKQEQDAQPSPSVSLKETLKTHKKMIIGILIATFGVVILWFALFGGLREWQEGITNYPPSAFNCLLEWSYLGSTLFFLSLLSLVIGIATIYTSEKDAQPGPPINLKQTWKTYKKITIGILLTAFGFTYQIIGAWVLWDKAYPWAWQTEIAKYGGLLIWPLLFLSLSSPIIGAALLYADSKRYHKRHPELYTRK